LLDLQCSGSDAPVVTPYRSPTHYHRPEYADRDARHPARAGSFSGHEERFSPTRLSARSAFGKQTFAGTRGDEEDTPILAVRITPPRSLIRCRLPRLTHSPPQAAAPSNPHKPEAVRPAPAGSFLAGFRTPALSTRG
jgi:hypothetical protein